MNGEYIMEKILKFVNYDLSFKTQIYVVEINSLLKKYKFKVDFDRAPITTNQNV